MNAPLPRFAGYRDPEAAARAALVARRDGPVGPSPSFGEFMDLAWQRLRLVEEEVRGDGTLTRDDPHVVRALVTLIGVLSKQQERFGWATNPGDSATAHPMFPRQSEVRMYLEQAEKHCGIAIRRDRRIEPARSMRVTASLGDVARLLRAAPDILSSHFDADGQDRTGQGAIVDARDFRAWTLSRIAEITTTTAAVTTAVANWDVSPGRRQALHDVEENLSLAAAALTDACRKQATEGRGAAAAVRMSPFGLLPDPVRADETRGAMLGGIDRSLTRMTAYARGARLGRDDVPPTTASAMRHTALGLAIAHHQVAAMLAHAGQALCRTVPEDERAGLAAQVSAAESDLSALAGHWRAVAGSWVDVRSAPDSGPSHPVTVDATSIATRVGRLLHDETWTPRTGGARRPPEAVVPHARAAVKIWDMLAGLTHSGGRLAAEHARATQQLARAGLLVAIDPKHRPVGFNSGVPYPITAGRLDPMIAAYRAVHTAAALAGAPDGAIARVATRLGVSPGRAEPEHRRSTPTMPQPIQEGEVPAPALKRYLSAHRQQATQRPAARKLSGELGRRRPQVTPRGPRIHSHRHPLRCPTRTPTHPVLHRNRSLSDCDVRPGRSGHD